MVRPYKALERCLGNGPHIRNDHFCSPFLCLTRTRGTINVRHRLADGCEDPRLQEAMDIAMTYLERTGALRLLVNAEDLVAVEVLGAWGRGVRHKIALANAGIVAAEKQSGTLPSVFPDVRLARQ